VQTSHELNPLAALRENFRSTGILQFRCLRKEQTGNDL
jgi:hypothetical protein